MQQIADNIAGGVKQDRGDNTARRLTQPTKHQGRKKDSKSQRIEVYQDVAQGKEHRGGNDWNDNTPSLFAPRSQGSMQLSLNIAPKKVLLGQGHDDDLSRHALERLPRQWQARSRPGPYESPAHGAVDAGNPLSAPSPTTGSPVVGKETERVQWEGHGRRAEIEQQPSRHIAPDKAKIFVAPATTSEQPGWNIEKHGRDQRRQACADKAHVPPCLPQGCAGECNRKKDNQRLAKRPVRRCRILPLICAIAIDHCAVSILEGQCLCRIRSPEHGRQTPADTE